ncbi:MAG: prepilin-type N-terminal cleavage/methylation domain-containing protein [Methylococcales bacterium]
MNKADLKSQTGFSLIEAMVAALVVGTGLLGLAKLQSGFFRNNGESRAQSAALHFAQQKLEALRSFKSLTDFDSQLVSGSDPDPCDPEATDSPCAGINSTLTTSWTVTACPNTVPCRIVTLNVAWTDLEGETKNTTLTSYIARNDPVDSGLAIANPTTTPTQPYYGH